MPSLTTLYARIDPARIHFLKFILEGYDGLAVLSTRDEQEGLVRLLFPAELRQEVEALLHDLAGQIDWQPAPLSLALPHQPISPA